MSAVQQILAAAGGGGDGPPTDPNFASVVLLLHFDGADGSTTFTDSSSYADGNWTRSGTPAIDTDQAQFGGSSCYFDGATDALFFDDDARFSRGTADFTIECWVRFGSSGTRERFAGQGSSSGSNVSFSFALVRTSSNTVEASVFSGATQYYVTSTATIGANTWAHVAFVRDGSTLRLFINGTDMQTASIGSASVNDSASKYAIGALGGFLVDSLYGWVDDWRDTIGAARYTAPFTPPDAAFPDS